MDGTHQTALIIFAREPREGKVKTRLQRDLSAKEVCELYKRFVCDVLAIAQATDVDQRFLFYADDENEIPFLCQFKNQFLLQPQTGRDLGERMHQAFEYCQHEGFEKVVIIGTDCLTLTSGDIRKAFRELEQHDCVLGPAVDGGYYLIGLKKPSWELFEDVAWSTSSVLSQTLEHAKRFQKSVFLLDQRDDIDTIESLQRMKGVIAHGYSN